MQANSSDPRRPNKIVRYVLFSINRRIFRYKPVDPQNAPVSTEDSIPEYMNLLGMIFSMCGLMMRVSLLFKDVKAIALKTAFRRDGKKFTVISYLVKMVCMGCFTLFLRMFC